MSANNRWLWAYPFTLPTNATSGSFVVRPPVVAANIVVLNTSGATLAYASGERSAQPPDAVTVPNNFNLGLPIEETQVITVWWTAPSDLAAGDNVGVILFSSESVVMASPNSAGGIASAVQVVNTITANINSMPGVTVTALPSITGSDYGSPAASHMLKVDASGTQYTTLVGTPDVTVANNTLLEAGIASTSQASIGAGAVALTIPTGCKSIAIKNMDSANPVYLGSSSAVTTADGFPLSPQQTIEFDTDPTAGAFAVYAIAAATVEVAVLGVK